MHEQVTDLRKWLINVDLWREEEIHEFVTALIKLCTTFSKGMNEKHKNSKALQQSVSKIEYK
jgi:hypothetical protein